MQTYDVVVVGTGAAGSTVATACATAGLRVAIVDNRAYGGTCRLRGCDPKKVLLAASDAVAAADGLRGQGLLETPRIDWPALMARKRSFLAGSSEDRERSLREAGVANLHGTARFLDGESLGVDGESLSARHFVIATGSRPAPQTFPGADLLATSETFMDLDELPRRVVFAGGGYISFEFAALARRAGAEVTILHRSARPLKGFDRDLVAQLVERYRSIGIDVRLERPVREVRRSGESIVVATADGPVESDLVVHGAGRVPDLDDLDLPAAGVRAEHGVVVDGQLRSVTNPRVFAAGDAAAPGLPLTPVAGRQGQVVADAILGGAAVYDPNATASVVFSDPPLTAVGMSTDEAAARDDVEVTAFDMSQWFTSRRLGITHAGAKIVREKDTGRLLGAHLLGAHAEEVINVFALAVHLGLTSGQVAETVWAYPTAGHDISYLI